MKNAICLHSRLIVFLLGFMLALGCQGTLQPGDSPQEADRTLSPLDTFSLSLPASFGTGFRWVLQDSAKSR